MENSQHLPTFVERTITWSTSRASFENWSEILVWSLKNLLAHHNNLHVVLMKMEFKLRDLPPMRTNDQCNRWNIFHDMECGTCWQHLMTHKSVLLMPIKLFRKKKIRGLHWELTKSAYFRYQGWNHMIYETSNQVLKLKRWKQMVALVPECHYYFILDPN